MPDARRRRRRVLAQPRRASDHGRPRLPSQDPETATSHGTSRATTAPRAGYLFAVRADKLTHARLVEAAYADGRTVGSELEFLLDLRDRYAALTRPAHPLGRVAPV